MSFYTRLESLRNPDETDRHFARRLNINHQLIGQWRVRHESGRSINVHIDTLRKLEETTGKNAGWFLDGERTAA